MAVFAHIETGTYQDAREATDVGTYRALFAGVDTGSWNIVAVSDASVEGSSAPVAAVAPPQWDAFTFKLRFTQAERMAIRTAAQQSAEVEDFLDMLDTAAAAGKMVVANDPLLIAGLAALTGAGLLAAGRSAQILGS